MMSGEATSGLRAAGDAVAEIERLRWNVETERLKGALEAEMQQAAKWLSTEYNGSTEHRALLKGKGQGVPSAQGGWDATAHRF